MRRLAYADPPYPGQAASRYNGTEVDHAALIDQLRTFDGWALSTSTPALREIWNLVPEARCAAWLKTCATPGWSRVRYSWEPVLFVTDRKGIKPGERSTVWDGLVAGPDHTWKTRRGTGGGAKPAAFVYWVLDLLDYSDEDALFDLFPGSGNVSRYTRQRQLELGP